MAEKSLERRNMPILSAVKGFVLGNRTNGKTAVIPVTEPASVIQKYKEYTPDEIPEEYNKYTPKWLYSRIDWRLQAKALLSELLGNTREKLRIGLTIAVIIFSGVILLCVFAIAMGGNNG